MMKIKMLNPFFTHTLCLIIVVLTFGYSHAAGAVQLVHIAPGDEWHYFKGLQKPPSNWTQNGFDDKSWLKGQTAIGYGIDGNRTILTDMRGNYSTVYVRHEFTITDIYSVAGMTLSVSCDGPFIAYLNGVEVIRNSAIRTEQSAAEPLNISGFIHELLPGGNVISAACSNDDINSNDFSFVPAFEIVNNN